MVIVRIDERDPARRMAQAPGQDRDEAGAKYLMQRVLHFANGAPASC